MREFYERRILKKLLSADKEAIFFTSKGIKIDKLVYKIYNLNEEDIKKVENWYFRRYPKLAGVIEEKLSRKNNGGK
jgi:hypothetical protein